MLFLLLIIFADKLQSTTFFTLYRCAIIKSYDVFRALVKVFRQQIDNSSEEAAVHGYICHLF